jgi:hypothetical protein
MCSNHRKISSLIIFAPSKSTAQLSTARNVEAQQRTDGISSHWMESEAQQRTECGDGASDVPHSAIAQDEKEHRGQGGHRRPPPQRVPGLRRGPPATGTKKRERERRGEVDGLLARRRRRLRMKNGRWSPSPSGMCRAVHRLRHWLRVTASGQESIRRV